MRIPTRFVLALLTVVLVAAGCARGQPTEKRPVVVIPDLEVQRKFRAQGETPFFADRRMMRTPPAGTLARGSFQGDDAYYRGTTGADSAWVTVIPLPLTADRLERGRDRYDIYCAPCHGRTGDGNGIVAGRGLVPPTSYHVDRSRAFADGYIYSVITHGVRNMMGYASQIPVEDRWAIVAYVRALQRSQYADLTDVPPANRGELR